MLFCQIVDSSKQHYPLPQVMTAGAPQAVVVAMSQPLLMKKGIIFFSRNDHQLTTNHVTEKKVVGGIVLNNGKMVCLVRMFFYEKSKNKDEVATGMKPAFDKYLERVAAVAKENQRRQEESILNNQ